MGLQLQCPSQSVLDGMATIMMLTGVATFITLIWGCMPAGYGRYMHYMSLNVFARLMGQALQPQSPPLDADRVLILSPRIFTAQSIFGHC